MPVCKFCFQALKSIVFIVIIFVYPLCFVPFPQITGLHEMALTQNSSCEYYTEDSFKNMLAKNQSRLNLKCSTLETGLSFLYMNIRSLSKKFDNLTNFLGQVRVKFPIIGISETWLDDCYHFSDIVGYNFLHKPKVNRIGGGDGLYIGEHLNYKERHDLAVPEDKSAEFLFVEVNRTKEKNIIVGIIYRPPDSKIALAIAT